MKYSAIILFFWVDVAVMVSPLVPVHSHWAVVTAYIAFTNMMACRVFRKVSVGMLDDSSHDQDGLSTTRIAAVFRDLGPATTGDCESLDIYKL